MAGASIVQDADGLTDSQWRTFLRWVLGGGLENLAIFSPVALPGLYKSYYQTNNKLNRRLRLGGEDGVPPSEGVNEQFVNLTGILGAAMGGALIYASRDLPNRWGIPVVSAVARLVAVAVIWYYVMARNVARVVLLFTAVDIAFAGAVLYYAARIRRSRRGG